MLVFKLASMTYRSGATFKNNYDCLELYVQRLLIHRIIGFYLGHPVFMSLCPSLCLCVITFLIRHALPKCFTVSLFFNLKDYGIILPCRKFLVVFCG